jgi:hypothetical protein
MFPVPTSHHDLQFLFLKLRNLTLRISSQLGRELTWRAREEKKDKSGNSTPFSIDKNNRRAGQPTKSKIPKLAA